MNKIPELTQEQIDILLDPIYDGNGFDNPKEYATNIYLDFLQIADAQGLLNKEASLMLKPDDWIEWERTEYGNYNGITKIGIIHIFSLSHIVFKYPNLEQIVINIDDDKFKTLEEAKEVCQNWLDEHLKEVKDE